MAVCVSDSIRAARSADGPAFAEAATALARVDRQQLGVLLGAMTRDLLERTHPDGLDSGDATAVVTSCVVAAGPWYDALEADYVVLALTGALGLSDPDGSTPVDGPATVDHGLLLIAGLLGPHRDLDPILDAALGELKRAQTIEMP